MHNLGLIWMVFIRHKTDAASITRDHGGYLNELLP